MRSQLVPAPLALLAGLALVATSACESTPEEAPAAAVAEIAPTAGSTCSGTATFTETDGGVHVVVEIAGASPGEHAVHVHEVGDCSAPDASSAGGHFNPDGVEHGAPGSPTHHPGDFGNVEVGADGRGRLELVTDDLTVRPGRYSVAGRAIIVHELPDTFIQPTGAAGGRIGCGVIR